MKKAFVFLVCILGIAGFTLFGMPHLQKAGASQDVQKVISSDKMQEVAGYGSDEGDSGGYGSDEGDSGGYGTDEGDSGDSGSDEDDSGGYGN